MGALFLSSICVCLDIIYLGLSASDEKKKYARINEITASSSLNISTSTAGRILRASGWVKFARKKPYISAASRVSWVRSQRHLTFELSPCGMCVKMFTLRSVQY